jgi:hypothetical protein
MTITVNPSTGVSATSKLASDTVNTDEEAQQVVPRMVSGGHLSLQTANPGTSYALFGSQACKQLTISNQTGFLIQVQQGGSGVGFEVPAGAVVPFFGLTNANQLGIKRADNSNAQVTVTARWEA